MTNRYDGAFFVRFQPEMWCSGGAYEAALAASEVQSFERIATSTQPWPCENPGKEPLTHRIEQALNHAQKFMDLLEPCFENH